MKTVYYELSDRCSLNCPHCHLTVKQRHTSFYVPFSQTLVDFAILQKLGITSIVLSGGETTLHPQLNGITDLAVKMFSDVVIMSNNTNPEILTHLDPKIKVWVSLDYFGFKQDKWRSFNGLWANYLSLANQVNVRSTLLNDNVVDIEKLVFHVSTLNRNITIAPYRGDRADLAPSPQDMIKLLSFIFQKGKKYYENAVIDDCSIRQYLANKQGKTDYVGCNACEGVIRVTPTAMVTPCPFLPQEIGSLYGPEIKQKIAETRQQLLNMFNGKCQTCQYKKTCGGCKSGSISNSHCFLT